MFPDQFSEISELILMHVNSYFSTCLTHDDSDGAKTFLSMEILWLGLWTGTLVVGTQNIENTQRCVMSTLWVFEGWSKQA
jgi:hypothetical protein